MTDQPLDDDYERRRIVRREDQWCAGIAECLKCGCEWVATWPLGAEPLRCPRMRQQRYSEVIMRCISTGCSLFVPGMGSAHGDLHVEGDKYVFVANVGPDSQPRYYDKPTHPREVSLDNFTGYFERRGIFIFGRHACSFNDALADYVRD